MPRGPKKATSIETTELCKFGCGNVAKFVSHSGGLLCESSANKCPANKAKNTGGKGLDGAKRYAAISTDRKDNMAWAKGKSAETDERVNRQAANRRKNFVDGKWKGSVAGVAINPEMRWKRNYIPYVDSAGKEFKLESIHEWEVANILDKNGIYWTRPEKIKLLSGVGYEPDFYLRDFNIYLDPKTKWGGSKYQGYNTQHKQLEKIRECEVEHNIRCLILWSNDKRSHTWEGILDQIHSYRNAPVAER